MQEADYKAAPVVKLESLSDVNDIGKPWRYEEDGLTVNRCEGIASLGGSQQNSEEEYLILKMMRSLGVVAIDNQARV